MAELKLYNTLTRTKEPFVPLDPANIRMYVCGPTVYDYAHIGNARPVIVFDVLFRLLRHLAKQGVWDGGKGETKVTYARNITDVDDKINDRAARDFPDLPLNEAIRKVTEATNAQFQADVKALGCLMPEDVNVPGKPERFVQPRATEHIKDMVDIVGKLLANGYAYIAHGAEGKEVLFSVSKMKAYGQLSNRKLDEQIEGARVSVEPHKRNAGDFVLWKESSSDQPGWDAEFVPDADYRAKYRLNAETITIYGRPGWHIECSAMSMAKLLEPFGGGLTCDDPTKNTFDIHGGGIDLVFPHHENEIAQSCCAFGSDKMATIWMHNGFLQVEGQKMSKSLGNFVTINEVLKDWPGEVARLNMLKTHYRQPIDWTRDGLRESRNTLLSFQKWFSEKVDQMYAAQLPDEFVSAICDDMNTAASIASLHRLANRLDATIRAPVAEQTQMIAQFSNALRLLGFDALHLLYHRGMGNLEEAEKANINSLINLRLAARNAKNWAESDRIRDELLAMGIQIMDSKDPITGELKTTWEIKR